MLDERTAELLSERLVDRIEETNAYILEQIGATIKRIGSLTPSKARQLQQILKYGGNYDNIVKKLADLTGMNVEDIKNIFEAVAKNNQEFAKQFYDYRGKKFVPYNKNSALKKQVMALAKITGKEYVNLSKSTAIGYTIRNQNGMQQFFDIEKIYKEVIDRAVMSVSQGKSSFDAEMRRIMKDLGASGLKTIDYKTGYSRRLDSTVRMNMQGALRDLSNTLQEQFGKEFDADGIEISVHLNPAEDHENVQGRQFSIEEYRKLQNGEMAKDYTGKIFTLDHDHKNGYRPISQMNCYHYEFSIVLGVNKPLYSEEQLQKILDDNEKGFEFEGKHYTNYEGTQLQRRIETEIRKLKDTQIIARASGDKNLVIQCQDKIRMLSNKYDELSKTSNLPTKLERLSVTGYKYMPYKKKAIIPKENTVRLNTNDNKFKIYNSNEEILTKYYDKYEKVFKNMDEETFTAFKKYTFDAYNDMNKLNMGINIDDNATKSYQEYLKVKMNLMDEEIKKHSFEENTTVFRATKFEFYNNYNEGDTIVNKTFDSTSLNKKIAEHFFPQKSFTYLDKGVKKGDGALLEIRCPKGTNGIYVGDYLNSYNEQEVILPRNTKYKIIKKTTEKIDEVDYEVNKIILEVIK